MSRVSAHLPGTGNIGDEVGSPAMYFDGLGKPCHIDKSQEADMTIYGGGSMLLSSAKKASESRGLSVGWALGDSTRGRETTGDYIDYDVFDLLGLRGWPVKGNADWVPCPSCMSDRFDNPPAPKQRVVHYGHAKLTPSVGLNNDCMDFDRVISYLCKGETVITSSYHGMVWATWLGRKVEVLPFGSKFYSWPYAWGVNHDNALSEARQANLQFHEKVMNL